MKKEHDNIVLKNDLEGKWIVTGMRRFYEGAWHKLYTYVPGSLIWDIVTETITGKADGIEYCGEVTEHFAGTETITHKYIYCPEKRLLRIEYFTKHWSMYFTNEYRVEKKSDTEYRLYDLFEVTDEPEDYEDRVEIEKADRP